MTEFTALGLSEPLCRAVAAEGYHTATPIQAQAIPLVLAERDVLGIAQTGTGKTAAFALPMLHRLSQSTVRPGPRTVRALVLTPTRELAIQVGQCFGTYGKNLKLRRTMVYGGVGMNPQVQALAQGTDILVATPGRLIDLLNRGSLRLDAVEILVLDEADRMLDMGFIPDIRKIVAKLPAARQTLLFSATMPQAIMALAESLLKNYQRVEVTPQAATVDRITQRVMFVETANKRQLLLDVLAGKTVERAIVFSRTKHGANRIAEQLAKSGVPAEAIHGNKSQGARQRALSQFQSGRVRTLVATDIAARGIDVDGITHVINFDMPVEPESYVHRIGRTARAGAEGIALSFCDAGELDHLRAIEKTIRQPVPVDEAHRFHCPNIARMKLAARGGGGGARPKQQAGRRRFSRAA